MIQENILSIVKGTKEDTLMTVSRLETSNVMGGGVHPEIIKTVFQHIITPLPCKLSRALLSEKETLGQTQNKKKHGFFLT